MLCAEKKIDILEVINSYSVDLMSLLSFKYDTNTLTDSDNTISQHFEQIFPMFNSRINFRLPPYWKYLKLPADKKLDRSMKKIRHIFIPIIQDARKNISQDV